MELIRAKLEAVQTEGHPFTEQSMFAKKMDVEGDISAVGKLYDTEWAKSEQHCSSCGMFGSFVFFLRFVEPEVW